MQPTLAVIGGTGLYDIPELSGVEQLQIETPYGPPSDSITRGHVDDTTLLFLPRHGKGHRFPPHQINYRANICALRMLGATQVVSISAVGSLREPLVPGDVVIVDQYIDRTVRRISTYFDHDVVAHVSMADPVCPHLAKAAADAATRAGARVHPAGTYLCIEGPQFSTRAESRMYRTWGADVIGMTALPEAKLAREAGLAYSTVALVTDYDCWHVSEAAVTVEMVVEVLKRNIDFAKRFVVELTRHGGAALPNSAARALDHAIMTNLALVPTEARQRLAWLLEAAR